MPARPRELGAWPRPTFIRGKHEGYPICAGGVDGRGHGPPRRRQCQCRRPAGSIKDDPYGGINWAGFYVGIQGGYGWGNTSHNFSGLNAGEWDTSGGVFGVSWGTNWQTGNWVYGFDSDFSFSSIDGSFDGVGCNTGTCFTDIRNLSTSRVRLGYAMDNRLIYVTGGSGVRDGARGSPQLRLTRTRRRVWAGHSVPALSGPSPPGGRCRPSTCTSISAIDHHYNAGAIRTDVDITADIVRVGVNYNLGPDFWRNMLGRR